MARRRTNPLDAPHAATPPDGARTADRATVLLLLVLAGGAVLRLLFLEDAPSLDELWSLELSTGRGSVQLELPVNQVFPAPAMTELASAPPPRAVWTSLDRVTHPPLYFLLLRGWREVFGGGDAAARWLSVAASLASVALLYDAVRRLLASRAAGLWAAALMAFAQPQVEHAALVRGYTLLQFFAVVAWWAVARLHAPAPPDVGAERSAERTRQRRLWPFHVTLAAATAALLLTHYFAVGAVGALLAYALLGLRGHTRWRAAGAVIAGVAVWLAAWGPTLYRHARHFSGADSTTDFLRRPAAGAPRVVETLADVLGAPLRLLVDLPQRTTPWAWLIGAGCLALLVHAAVRRRRELLLPSIWLAGTIGFVAALDLARSTRLLHEVRYLLLAAPAVYVLIAAAFRTQAGGNVSPTRRVPRHLLPASAALLGVAGLFGNPRPPELDWRPLAEFLDEPGRANDAVVFVREGQADWFAGYQVMAYQHASALPAGRPIALIDPPGAEPLVARLRERGRCWMVHLSGEQLPLADMVPGFEVRPAGVPGFPPVVWELRPPPPPQPQPQPQPQQQPQPLGF